MKLYLATSREIGEQCLKWVEEYRPLPPGWELSPSMDDCDVFISVMYDKIIPPEYIASHRCYNFHPGVLPWYRGAGAYSWALINGEFESGVTLHEIDRDIDHGDVIFIGRFSILPTDTAGELFKKAEQMIFKLFQLWLVPILTKQYGTTKQEEGRIYYRKHLEKAKDLTRTIRAFSFPGKESAFYFNSKGEKIHINYE